MVNSILSDRIYIKADLVNPALLKIHFETKVYNGNECRKCPLFKKRHTPTCSTCDNYLGILKSWGLENHGGKKLIAVPSGDIKNVSEKLGIKIDFKDIRPIYPFREKLKFTGKLYIGGFDIDGNPLPNQQSIVQEYLDYVQHPDTGAGIIEAKPRSGKTAMAVYITCQLKVRTLVTTSQIDYLRQFAEAFGKFTNSRWCKGAVVLVDPKFSVGQAKNFATKHGITVLSHVTKELLAFPPDVLMLTYQTFLGEYGKPRIKIICNKVSLVVVDEAHQSSAVGFSRVINRITARYRLGLTATIRRADGLQPVMHSILGQVAAQSNISSLCPTITLWETGIYIEANDKTHWPTLLKRIMKNKDRNLMILRQVFKDLRSSPLHSILIPVERVEHVNNLVTMINSQARYFNRRGENWQQQLAIPFLGSSNRDVALLTAKKGICRVVVATIKLVKHGIDVPNWTHVYVAAGAPTSNAPVFYQLSSRVATAMKGKKEGIVRIMVDNTPASLYCLRKLYKDREDGIKTFINENPCRYVVSNDQKARMEQIIKKPTIYNPITAPEFTRLSWISPLNSIRE